MDTNDTAKQTAADKADDLSAFDSKSSANEGATMTVQHPTETRPLYNADGSPMTINFLGSDSADYRKAEDAALNAQFASGGRRGGATKLTAKQVWAQNLTKLVAVTQRWNLTLDGEKPDCNEVNARRIFEKYPWLKEQGEDFVNDRSNFMKASAND